MKSADSLMRLRKPARLMLHGTISLLFLSGLGWIAVHYASDVDEMRRLAAESIMLKFHGGAAFAMLIAAGAMFAHHVRRAWLLGRNRVSGAVVIAILAVLIVTAYALYYLATDSSRPSISAMHWIVGVAFVPMLIAHMTIGRRTTELRSANTRRLKRKATAHSSAR
jgi:uncharacterized membrane protein